MAVSWSFALLLILTLVALITFSQPLFESTPVPVARRTQADLEIVPQAVIARGVLRHNLLSSKANNVRSASDGVWRFGILRGSQRQRWTRKLIQLDVSPPCDAQQKQVICRGKRKTVERAATIRSISTADRPPRTRAGDSNPPCAKSGIPRRSVAAHFESDRMVPTGPNPLHNSNRSQVIFP